VFRKLTITVSLALLCAGVAGAAPPRAPAEPVPARLRTLADLQRVSGPKSPLTEAQRTETLLSWLAQERRRPTPSRIGQGGYEIDTGYIQAQVRRALAGEADPVVIEHLAGSTQVRDPQLRTAMRLVLGLMGDARQVPALLTQLKQSPEPYYRWHAAQALGGIGAAEAVPALRQAQKDTFLLTSRGGARSKRGEIVFPVRDAARVSREILANPQARKEGLRQRARFKQRLEQARRARKSGKGGLPLSRAVAALNRG